jgi:hypothetical protein
MGTEIFRIVEMIRIKTTCDFDHMFRPQTNDKGLMELKQDLSSSLRIMWFSAATRSRDTELRGDW